MADIGALAAWYSEQENYDNPILLIIDDMERCYGTILAEFIIMLRYSWPLVSQVLSLETC